MGLVAAHHRSLDLGGFTAAPRRLSLSVLCRRSGLISLSPLRAGAMRSLRRFNALQIGYGRARTTSSVRPVARGDRIRAGQIGEATG
jgi:hypothetical protein